MPNVCKISHERHVISCIWVRRVQVYPGCIPSYCRPLSKRVRLTTKYLTQKDHLHILKVYSRRSSLLSQSSKSLSRYQPTWKGGLYLPNSPNLYPVLCLEPCYIFSLILTTVRCRSYIYMSRKGNHNSWRLNHVSKNSQLLRAGACEALVQWCMSMDFILLATAATVVTWSMKRTGQKTG